MKYSASVSGLKTDEFPAVTHRFLHPPLMPALHVTPLLKQQPLDYCSHTRRFYFSAITDKNLVIL